MKIMSAIAALLISSVAAFAQNSIRVEAPNMVATDEQFNVTFTVDGEKAPTDFQWSPGEDFQLVWGPQRGTSTSVTIVNGKTTKTSQSSYTYVLLPKRSGSFTLPAATATVKGDRVSSKSITIEVVGGGQSSSPGSSQSQGQEEAQTAQASSDDLFMRLNLSKSRVVVGEPINVVLKLYQRTNVAGFEDARFPTFNGFWSQEVQAPTNIEFHRENIGDQIYNAAVLRSWVIIPQQSGDLTVDPAELVCLVNVRTRSNSTGSIFDSFFQDDYRTVRKRITTPAVTVRVTALPGGAPASFSGGVGSYTLQASLTRDSLKAHDAASLKVTVSGKGNVSLLEAPKVNFPPDFEVYDVKTTESTDKGNGRTSGSRTFEYPFIPRSHGDFVIDPIEFSYYDVNSRKYVTLTSGPMEIKVAKGAESESVNQGVPASAGVSRKDVKDLGSDIRYIRSSEPSFRQKGSFFVFSGGFWGLFAAMIAAGAGVWFALRKRAALKADVAGSKNRAATKMARKRLANASEFLRKDLYTAFYEELHKALLGYVGDKLNIDIADMSRDNIASRLSESGVPQSSTDSFCSLLEDCEMARYSPDTQHNAMNEHFEKAVNVISEIDSSVRGKSSSLKKVLPALLLLLAIPMGAAEWEDGVAAYEAGDYAGAVSAWSAIEAEGLESVDLYYNLGNAWFKQDEPAKAILYYERALRLAPSDKDVKHNLEFARTFTQDRIEEIPEILIEQVGHKICNIMPSNAWCALFFVFLGLAICCALLYLLSRIQSRRKAGFFTGIAMVVLSLLCLDFAQWQWSDFNKDNHAIVMRAVSSAKSSPSQTASKDLFVLHEGTKVKVLDTVGEWVSVELSDGRQGWLREADIELI